MKAARLTAIGMVAAATLWIASGHLMPHDSAQGEAAVRARREIAAAVPRRRHAGEARAA